MAQLRANVRRVARRGVGDFVQTPFATPSNSVKDASGNWVVQNPWAGPPVLVNKASLVSATLNRKRHGSGPSGVGPRLVNKSSLVNATLGRIVRKQLGMGDDSPDTSAGSEVIPGTGQTADELTNIGYTQDQINQMWASVDPNVITSGQAEAQSGTTTPSGITPSSSSSPMSPVAGGYKPTTNTSTNPLSQLLNSVFGGSTTAPKYGASGLSYNLGQGLNTPIYAGSSITNGGVVLIGGVLLAVVLMFKKK